MIRRSLLLVAALLALPCVAAAQSEASKNVLKLDKPENAPAAKITDVAWIEGHWLADALGGQAEEIWAAPMAGAMFGCFRSVRDGKVGFYELLVLSEESNSLTLRIKHFHADLKGWEKQDESTVFRLVKLTPDAAYFDGLTMKKEKDGGLTVWVLAKRGGGEPRELEFKFRPKKGTAAGSAAR